MLHSQLSNYTNEQLSNYSHDDLASDLSHVFIFVYDRTAEDVNFAKRCKYERYSNLSQDEKDKWRGELKGAVTAETWNRVESNEREIATELAVTVSTKSWDRSKIPRYTDYERILSNLAKIRSAYGLMSDTPPVPMRPLNTYQKWNDIEKILHDVHYVFTHSTSDVYYCDTEVYAGEGVGII